jgi:uncharacterized protein
MYKQHFSSKLSDWLELYPSLIVPGLRNSDARHWQSLWQSHLPNSRRVELNDWNLPGLINWKAGIHEQLKDLNQPVILIAHSFGALASVSYTADFPEKVAALFLVAPADPDKFSIREQLPKSSLNKPVKLIASSNDPWLADSKAAHLALQWGADYLCLKNVGHINSDSNLGIWQEGFRELQQLIRSAQRQTKTPVAV